MKHLNQLEIVYKDVRHILLTHLLKLYNCNDFAKYLLNNLWDPICAHLDFIEARTDPYQSIFYTTGQERKTLIHRATMMAMKRVASTIDTNLRYSILRKEVCTLLSSMKQDEIVASSKNPG